MKPIRAVAANVETNGASPDQDRMRKVDFTGQVLSAIPILKAK